MTGDGCCCGDVDDGGVGRGGGGGDWTSSFCFLRGGC